ncbi:MAG TPA: hypothetical protein VJB41_03635 [Patescibacteria group bacterium]|uniref:Uncharacterized protein n=1 Tax=Candidatus Nomurabacteria bacterium RIFOXYC2_FULL_36_19 TaxID=1801806 RepID=A0A1F6YW71_9BACT|nr:MAG: hypothetical protein A2238_03180 [Candidatus Nomurabacteria bacterium RIFOXYA2_FULL_35_9]OGJ10634.1 MAG: hypothetical protein A2456_01420 [Candidatus Nomurabacteria bacterium RIFOXYC2_FULL_36_19]OGJ13596.1 MAG: hypothetical protein A2554_02455 [Candidatus Nomurabacteria bacterium RIFOXYD2_FULL_35_12]HLD31252.1 hypothetical protein [Patescibacteria group bacterium]
MTKDEVKNKIEAELKKREKSVCNKNAIEKFLGLFSPLDALWGVLVGSKDALELEKQKLTLEKVLDLLIGIDDKLSGKDISNVESGLKILIENAVSGGDITGLEGNTSDENIKKIFEKPLDIEIRNVNAIGNITGVKLNVDGEMPVKGQTRIKMDFGILEINPQFGEITLGEGLPKKEPEN